MRHLPPHPVLLLVCVIFCMPARAADNPQLFSLERGITDSEDPARQESLVIASLHVDIHVHGRMADATLEARLTNLGDETDEARFSLALPPDAVVTGYALDVEGRMIDGRLLDQPKARNVYEDEVREEIDPGLAELTDENRFQAYVYPVTHEQPRIIRVSFSVPLGTSQGFILPLQGSRPVAEASIRVSIEGYRTPPRVILGGTPLEMQRGGHGWHGLHSTRNLAPAGDITVVGGRPASALLVSRHRASDKLFFQVGDAGIARAPSLSVGRLRIYWDRSLSRRDDLLEQEVSLLSAYVDAARPDAIDLVTFASDAPTVTTETATGLRGSLDRIAYRGGTNMAALQNMKLAPADQCLLFTDGLLTLDPQADFHPDCRLSIIASAPDASGLRLGRLAQRSMGQLLRLTTANEGDLLSRLLKPAIAVVAAHDDFGHRLEFRALPGREGGWLVVGEMPQNGGVQLTIAGLRRGLTIERYRPEFAHVADCSAPAVLWASQRAAELSDDPLAHDAMVGLARRYQVASPTMAFLVLERPEQYLSADIRPPSGLPKEWMKSYREAKREHDANAAERKTDRLDFVLEQWKKRKEWWNSRFTPMDREQVVGDRERERRAAEAAGVARFRSGGVYIAPGGDDGGDLQEIMVTGMRVRTDVQDAPVAITSLPGVDEFGKAIELDVADVLVDQPYIKALDAAGTGERLAVLAAQEKVFGSLPAFYLETSEWFRLKGELQMAEDLLFSALELAVTDDETRQIVAFRLQREGKLDRAIGMLERITVTSSFRPQPRRALALALAERGRARGARGVDDLERAFALLASVALEPAIGDFDGIETIALMEANALIPAIKAAGGSWTLDPRLEALLETDLRIVIEWTTDDADVDLWVIEPNGEKVYYGDQVSSGGGTISNDMTDGYGPEEYLIRRATAGEYQVRINGYESDRLNPNGHGRVLVRMIRDFGRPNASETFVDADLRFETGPDRDENGGTLIARLKVTSVAAVSRAGR